MADIKCPRCLEPWDIDEIHEYVLDMGDMFPASASVYTFDSVYQTFRRSGCGAAFDGWKVSCEPDRSGRGRMLRELVGIFGEHADDYAAVCDDLDALGGGW